ncbi:PP2C family protein-serine/threonine phosphatase [Allosalinactinospora lopnorensis]|uniref:PP2C family protein-serine/threonine phosphatase n=1 Tax=Allosalinactinospora lopnorensis TaxID=1352348 RepID=UPI000695D678|nr:SpoIIE family protein phosphatase [Allosalinactinospora lopnorensis]
MLSDFTDAVPLRDANSRRPPEPRGHGPRPPSWTALAAALDGVSEAVVITDLGGLVRSLHGTARDLLPGLEPGSDIAPFLTAAPGGDTPAQGAGRGRYRTPDGTAVSARITRLHDGMVWHLSRPEAERDACALRMEFLNEAARQLSASLQLGRVTRLAARLPVPRLAGACCHVALRPEGGADWTCASAAPGTGPPALDTTTAGYWDAAAVAGTDWLSDLAGGYEGRIELRPGDFGTEPEKVLPAPPGGLGPMLAVPVHGVTGTIGALLFARGSGDPGFTGAETEVLTEYAERVGIAVSAATLYQEQSRTADTLKSALVPAPLPDLEGIGLGSAYRSARETDLIGGDYYEVAEAEDGIEFLFGDVSGKGIDAAVLTGMVRQSVRALRLLERRPLRLLELLNEVLLRTGIEEFSTVVLGRAARLGDGGLRVEMAAGGHPPPLLLRADGTVEEIELSGMFVGAIGDAVFDSVSFTVHPGESLLLYSDGVTEARSGLLDGEMFGEERLARLLADCAGMPAATVPERIEQVVEEWLDDGPHDDIAVLALQPGGSRPPSPAG